MEQKEITKQLNKAIELDNLLTELLDLTNDGIWWLEVERNYTAKDDYYEFYYLVLNNIGKRIVVSETIYEYLHEYRKRYELDKDMERVDLWVTNKWTYLLP